MKRPSLPVPILPDEIISVQEAAFRASVGEKTIRRWVKGFGIGRQATRAAAIQISAVALEMRLCGDDEAIELLRQNLRDHPTVGFYIDRVGVRK